MKKTWPGFLLFYIAAVFLIINPSPAAAAQENQSAQVKPMFSDVTSDNPNYVFASYLAKRGIMIGFSDGSFHPDEGLTRAQAAVLIDKAAGLSVPAASASSFKDVPGSHWAVNYISVAEKAGYLKGFSDGGFHPDEKLTRAQAISLVMRLSSQKERASLPVFQDMSQKHWAAADMATALELKMIGSDGQKINPDIPATRAGVARALATLLTKDPGLSQVGLSGLVKGIEGNVTLTRGGADRALTVGDSILEGDIIKTSQGGKANLVYPDGSSILIEENTRLAVTSSKGRSYIKQDGTPAIAVEFLDMDVKEGIIFGALAARRGGDGNDTTGKQQALAGVFASRDSFRQLAAAQNAQSQPWYKTAQSKRVKMKVDMPWGVAAVRGTFFMITVNKDGSCKISCLTGAVDVNGTNGSSVPLGDSQTSLITGQGNSPTQASAMDADEITAFAQEQSWLVQTAIQMDLNQEAAALDLVINVNQQNIDQVRTTVLEAIITALQATGVRLSDDVVRSLEQQLQQIDLRPIYDGRNIQGQIQPDGTADGRRDTTDSTRDSSDSRGNNDSSDSGSTTTTYTAAGTYGPADGEPFLTVQDAVVQAEGVVLRNMNVLGNLTVNKASVVLQNINIAGNLVMGTGIGNGDATLISVAVTGNTLIAGGGANSIHMANCTISTITVDKADNSVRIVVEGNTEVGTLTLDSGAILVETGLTGDGFSDIIASSEVPPGANIILAGEFDSLVINAPNLNISLESGIITDVLISSGAANTSLYLAGGTSVGTLTAHAAASITGTGGITSAVISVNGVEFETAPLSWSLGAGVTISIAGTDINFSGTISHECSVTGIAILSNVEFAGTNISGSISDVYVMLTIAPTISDFATWDLYSDASCETLIDGNSIDLTATTIVYIKVTAQDGYSCDIYKLTINRIDEDPVNTACNMLGIADLDDPSFAGDTIMGQVSGATDSLTITPTLSEGATFQIFSDEQCNNEVFNPVTIDAGTNVFYIKVTAEDGSTNQVYVLTIYRPSNSADVTSSAYTINVDSITAGSEDITTSVTVNTFLSNLAKDPEAAWKVVADGTLISTSVEFDSAAAKSGVSTIMFGDILAVKAGDGTINTYTIDVVLGDPVVGAGERPAAPAGLKINYACTGFTWGKYRYFAYDFADDRNAIAIVAFDNTDHVVGQWERSRGQSKYVTGYSIEIRNQLIKFSTNKGSGIPVSFADIILLPQP